MDPQQYAAKRDALRRRLVEAMQGELSPVEALRELLAIINAKPDSQVTVSIWTPEDVQSVIALSDREVRDFMARKEWPFKERMVELGWETWIALAREEGISLRGEDQDT